MNEECSQDWAHPSKRSGGKSLSPICRAGRPQDYLTMATKDLGKLSRERGPPVATEKKTHRCRSPKGRVRLSLPGIYKSLPPEFEFLINDTRRGGNSAPRSFSDVSSFPCLSHIPPSKGEQMAPQSATESLYAKLWSFFETVCYDPFLLYMRS